MAAIVLLASSPLGGCVQSVPASVEPGVLLGVAPGHQASEAMGNGAVAGLVVGAAAGGALGSGAGRVLGAAIGGALGGTAGAAAEGAAQPTDSVTYTVRLADGRVLTILQHREDGEALIPPGQAVLVETSGRAQRVRAAAAG